MRDPGSMVKDKRQGAKLQVRVDHSVISLPTSPAWHSEAGLPCAMVAHTEVRSLFLRLSRSESQQRSSAFWNCVPSASCPWP